MCRPGRGRRRGTGAPAAALVLLLASACAPPAGLPPLPAAASAPAYCAGVETQGSRFRFRSSFWLNLHNFLFQEGKRARGIRNEVPSAETVRALEGAPQRALRPDEAERWARAVDYYAGVIVSGPHPDSVVIRVNQRLALSDSLPGVDDDVFDGRLAATLLGAAPIYRDVWWPGHDARNRAWIREMEGLLSRWEGCLGPRLAAGLGSSWPDVAIPVDATSYASWFGAYTTLDPPHVTIASTAVGSQGTAGLETLLHEAGHPLLGALEDALGGGGPANPSQLGHLVLFYTAGEVVRRAVPEHRPNAERFGIWSQNSRARRLQSAVERSWLPWLDGARPFEEAAGGLRRAAG